MTAALIPRHLCVAESLLASNKPQKTRLILRATFEHGIFIRAAPLYHYGLSLFLSVF